MKCKHDDGWVLKEEIVDGQDNVIVEVQCNLLGCGVRRFMEVDISDARPLSKEQIDELTKFGRYKLDKKGFVK